MSKCKRCVSERVAYISGKCSDLSFFELDGHEYNGYVPSYKSILCTGKVLGSIPD